VPGTTAPPSGDDPVLRAVWVCVPCANCVKRKIANRKAAIIHHNNAVDCKRNENAVAGVGRLNFVMLNKSVTTEVRKEAVELAVSLCCSNC